jgi:hypothetical protein
MNVLCAYDDVIKWQNDSELLIFHTDITREVGSPIVYEDFHLRDEISYSQITTNQDISSPEADYVCIIF